MDLRNIAHDSQPLFSVQSLAQCYGLPSRCVQARFLFHSIGSEDSASFVFRVPDLTPNCQQATALLSNDAEVPEASGVLETLSSRRYAWLPCELDEDLQSPEVLSLLRMVRGRRPSLASDSALSQASCNHTNFNMTAMMKSRTRQVSS